ncbi:uncharacterized protein BX663DRAFT_483931 [Cokeromyces recurvatus]|uniref:uncharacterized protein n=1 Tax=Cokeromyces recurvatus TaxID=90255 RepID=UPI00221FC71A|nr:uncharacterized protein BX663DRAFT_483931 [Cokeromyces recurvatus]KAI7905412.1 hypothetical protein BX663DRAFT_483931 [Cokeromyces recurvatus]
MQFLFRLNRAHRPGLIPTVTPDYPPGCKCIAKSENYLEALAKPNVTVVPRADTEGNEQQEVDILVLATGFDVDGFLGNLSSSEKKYFIHYGTNTRSTNRL